MPATMASPSTGLNSRTKRPPLPVDREAPRCRLVHAPCVPSRREPRDHRLLVRPNRKAAAGAFAASGSRLAITSALAIVAAAGASLGSTLGSWTKGSSAHTTMPALSAASLHFWACWLGMADGVRADFEREGHVAGMVLGRQRPALPLHVLMPRHAVQRRDLAVEHKASLGIEDEAADAERLDLPIDHARALAQFAHHAVQIGIGATLPEMGGGHGEAALHRRCLARRKRDRCAIGGHRLAEGILNGGNQRQRWTLSAEGLHLRAEDRGGWGAGDDLVERLNIDRRPDCRSHAS